MLQLINLTSLWMSDSVRATFYYVYFEKNHLGDKDLDKKGGGRNRLFYWVYLCLVCIYIWL